MNSFHAVHGDGLSDVDASVGTTFAAGRDASYPPHLNDTARCVAAALMGDWGDARNSAALWVTRCVDTTKQIPVAFCLLRRDIGTGMGGLGIGGTVEAGRHELHWPMGHQLISIVPHRTWVRARAMGGGTTGGRLRWA